MGCHKLTYHENFPELKVEQGKDFACEKTGVRVLYFGARYYNSDISVWLSVDPLADERPNLSPYNYSSWNPVMRTDPTGMLDDWVGTTDSKGNTTWKWDASITSEAQAKKAGYDEYAKPGTNVTNAKGERVRLGDNGVVYTKIIGINSNVDSDAGFTDGHAWVSVYDVDGNLLETYSLWPDDHQLFRGTDPNGTKTDVRKNTEKNAGYATSSSNHTYAVYVTKKQENAFYNFVKTYNEWGYLHTCADWSRDAFYKATGIRIDVDDYFGIETPRELSKSIMRRKKKNKARKSSSKP